MIPVVLDTNAALDLLHFGDPRCDALRAALDAGRARLFTDAPCRDEFRRVLRYAALRLDAAGIARLEQDFDARCEPVEVAGGAPLPRCRDADDQKFLELARNAGAAWLLTRDVKLLRLSRRTQRDAGFIVAAPESFRE